MVKFYLLFTAAMNHNIKKREVSASTQAQEGCHIRHLFQV